jgi:hypothetical protein
MAGISTVDENLATDCFLKEKWTLAALLRFVVNYFYNILNSLVVVVEQITKLGKIRKRDSNKLGFG